MVKFKKKGDKHNFKLVLLISFLISVLITVADIMGKYVWKAAGDQAYIRAEHLMLQQFWYMVAIMIFLVGLVYWIKTRDLSESVAIIIFTSLIILSGLEDILYFIFKKIPIPESLPWLINGPAGFVSKYIMGLDTVTPIGLILNVIIFILIATGVAIFLEDIN